MVASSADASTSGLRDLCNIGNLEKNVSSTEEKMRRSSSDLVHRGD